MRIIAIGDTHGRTTWLKILAKEEWDQVVFIGDYFDSKDGISAAEQIHNFNEIVSIKEAFPDRVHLLFGNHDYHYLKGVNEQYSGYQAWHKWDIQEALELNRHRLQMAYGVDNLLFSHAGVTKTWLTKQEIPFESNIALEINDLFLRKPEAFRFTQGVTGNNYGDDITQTPIWVRPKSLQKDQLNNYIQIVGHTAREHLKITESLIKIDCIDAGEYLIVQDGVFSVGKV